MPCFEIEITRIIEYKGWVAVQADDENAAYPKVQALVDAKEVSLEKICDETLIGPVHKLT